ncbi:hypothetical protein IV203_016456 [Nitzschia inconspicua]|uniref:Uncharacterized protein n=1 Tax=Nitzschia inconspicua TaxID=303405 RepID=A0A9K3KQN1_9STRA|nr:hypothetical protein IV203_016456 [Nitzschia inconspicua]
MSSLSYCLLPPLQRSHLSHDASSSYALTNSGRTAEQDQRVKFLLFVKILFRYLRATKNVVLLARAELLVQIIVQEHRTGHAHFEPLFDNVETRLRLLVGEYHWRRAHSLMMFYLRRKASSLKPGISEQRTRRTPK